MRKKLFKLYLTLVLLSIAFLNINAAPSAWKQKGIEDTFSLGGNEYINLFNGRLNFTLPLLDLKGRGKSGYSIPLSIQNNVWRRYVQYEPHDFDYPGSPQQEICVTQYLYTSVNVDGDSSSETVPYTSCGYTAGTPSGSTPLDPLQYPIAYLEDSFGLDPGFGPGKLYSSYELKSRQEWFGVTQLPANIPNMGYGRLTYIFALPDGSLKTFVDTKSMGSYQSYSRVNGEDVYYDRGRTFTTIDGSSMTYISDTAITDGGIPVLYSTHPELDSSTGYIITADGTRYRIEQGLVKWIQDIDGNKTSFSYTQVLHWSGGDTESQVSKITDSLGREVDFSYNVNDNTTAPDGNPYGLRDEISYTSLGGVSKKIIITKSDLSATLRSDLSMNQINQTWTGEQIHTPYSDVLTPRKKVISTVWMPDGQAIKFKYDSFGNLSRVVDSNGSATEYDYTTGILYNFNNSVRRRVTEKRVYSDANNPNSLVNKTTFSDIYPQTNPIPSILPVQVDVKDSNNNLLSRSKHYFQGDPYNVLEPNEFARVHGLDDALAGKEIKTEIINPITQSVYQRTEYNWQTRVLGNRPTCTRYSPCPPVAAAGITNEIPARDPILVETKTTLEPNGANLVTKTTAINPSNGSFAFDEHSNQTDSWVYDYGIGNPGRLLKHSQTNFLKVNPSNSINYANPNNGLDYTITDPHLKRLPQTTKLFDVKPDGTEVLISQNEILYDEPAYPIINVGSTTGWTDPNTVARGNPTTSKILVQETNTWLETHSQYDNFGNSRKIWDISGDTNRFTETQYGSEYYYAYPTKVITPAPDSDNTGHGTTEKSELATTYDFNTGLPLTVTNLNDLTTSTDDLTTATEYDDRLRLVRVYPTNFTAPESRIEYGVPDSNGQFPANQRFVKNRKQIDATNWDEATVWFDGLGRTIKTQSKDSQGDVFTETKYDNLGRIKWASNPYRLSDTRYWSHPRYDELGRNFESCAPVEESTINFASDLPCPTGTSLGVTSYSISTVSGFVGTVVTSADASQRKSRSITNVLGQLLRVDEATGTSTDANADLGTLASPNQPTFYTYSPQGKMVKVQQGKTGDAAIQYRYFLYDSLGRLIRVRQPEQDVNTPGLDITDPVTGNNQWTAAFAYDLSGNIKRATDANGTNIINEYDKANRITKKCYTKQNIVTTALNCSEVDGNDLDTYTPAVEYFYDGKGLDQQQSPNAAKGKLTKVTSSVSETRYTTFDSLGRLTQMEQHTPVGLETIANATPRVSKYQYNFAGALIQETYPSNRVVNNDFNANGDLSRIYGKANSISTERTYANSFTYTADGKIEKLKLGNGRWEWAKFNERLQVRELALGKGVADASLWDLKYDYGELQSNGVDVDANKNTGNIAKQTLNFTGLTNPLVQTYKYDSLYRLTEARETSNNTQNWIQTLGYDRFGNRTSLSQNVGGLINNQTPTVDPNKNRFGTGQGFTYDKNGNIIQDKDDNGVVRTFVFNGDNKQRFVVKAGSNLAEYFYDGEGHRVKKKVYEADGVTVKEETVFVYSAGKLVEEYSTKQPPSNPTTSYTGTDHLNSPRVITDSLGNVISRRDFMPFGEELTINVGERSNNLKYGTTDSVRQKFTGYQKDDETELDFAEARMYEERHGRFTAVDPLMTSGKSANPQTFNRYAYTSNNPIIRVDINGKDWIIVNYQIKTKETVKTKGGGTRTIETTTTIQTPTWVDPNEAEGIPRVNGIWQVTTGDKQGYIALNPNKNESSEIFDTSEKAQAVLDKWVSEANNPEIQLVVFESTLFSGADGATFKGVTGHVAWGINNQTWSWDNTGYSQSRRNYPTFNSYLDHNFSYRSGTVYQLDFGSPESNRAAAEEIKLGPRNASRIRFFGSGFNIVTNNCGETMCRVEQRLQLPQDNSLLRFVPSRRGTFLETSLRGYIKSRQRFTPPPPPSNEFSNGPWFNINGY